MALEQAFIAATRFGLGPRPDELRAVGGDPRGWLRAQLDHPQQPAVLATLPPAREQVRRYFALRREIMAERKQLAAAEGGTPTARMVSPGMMRNDAGGQAPAAVKSPFAALGRPIRELYMAEVTARTLAAVRTDTPLYERLVAFWSNHFTVSTQRGEVAGLCGPFEREAIRPHVLGRFVDLLNAVTRHPAMLVYLDNARSAGPNSMAALRGRKVGLNENLGRELLELHTLGVDTGYTQADVIAMAKILTGWTIVPPAQPDAGDFRFAPRLHEPGPKALLGVRYDEGGIAEGETALAALARHPATAHHIAEKLARHFIADDPPPGAVQCIAAVYRRTEGDLHAVTRAVIESPEAWRQPLAKMKSPEDFVVSTVRATGFDPPEPKMLVNSLRLLGQMPFAAPSPAGWGDRASDWLGPEALMHRIEWSRAVARRIGRSISADAIVAATIAPVASPATLQTIAAAGDPADRLTLVLASREFQRR